MGTANGFEKPLEGNVKKHSCALDLICIVDQKQDYASSHHGQFAMRHLEVWHSRHRKTFASLHAKLRRFLDVVNIGSTEADHMTVRLYDYLDNHA